MTLKEGRLGRRDILFPARCDSFHIHSSFLLTLFQSLTLFLLFQCKIDQLTVENCRRGVDLLPFMAVSHQEAITVNIKH